MSLIRPKHILTLLIAVGFSHPAGAQTPLPTATPIDQSVPNLTKISPGTEISGEQKALAYSKLMEGQRYLWKSNPRRSPVNDVSNTRLARSAFQRAVELDPDLAEAYTALAELAIDADEAIRLSALAAKIEPDNFGSHRMLARLYTLKSRFNTAAADKTMIAKAVGEWKEVVRLDPRNAEAWAFLSEFYYRDGNTTDQITALKKWIASASPISDGIYRRVMGANVGLTSETASVKLGTALVVAGQAVEAVTVLSEVVADDPENADAVDQLQEAIEIAGPAGSESAVNTLSAAVFANPGNVSLVNLLVQIHVRTGHLDDAFKVVRDASERVITIDRSAASVLNVSLGDLFASNYRVPESIGSYEKALAIRGIKEGQAVGDHDREFVMQVLDKMIKAYKSDDRMTDAKEVIDRSRKLLGKNDLFTERQAINFFRETGRRDEALAALRALRLKFPNDYGLLRLEASVLTEFGKVDQGVALIKDLIDNKSTAASGPGNRGNAKVLSVPPVYDDFTNYLFMSHLYNQASRGNDAKIAADRAYDIAGSMERKQLARLSLATTHQMSGDFSGAEAILRDILKQTPGNPIALNNLGYFLLERNERVTEALGLIQRALKIDPTNPSYLDSLGWGQFILGNFEEAERNLRTAARSDYGSETIHEHLGDVYSRQGKLEKARASWQRALNMATSPKDISRLKNKLKQ